MGWEAGSAYRTCAEALLPKSTFTARYQLLREHLVAARHRRALTQAELAQALGRPQTFVSKYERGERRLDVVELIAVAEALGVDPSRLVKDLARLRAKKSRAGQ